jgi:hypothetical protein
MNPDDEDCAAMAKQIDRLSVPSHEIPHLPTRTGASSTARRTDVAGTTAASRPRPEALRECRQPARDRSEASIIAAPNWAIAPVSSSGVLGSDGTAAPALSGGSRMPWTRRWRTRTPGSIDELSDVRWERLRATTGSSTPTRGATASRYPSSSVSATTCCVRESDARHSLGSQADCRRHASGANRRSEGAE